MRRLNIIRTKALALVLTIAALTAGQSSAWAANTFSVTSSTSAGITTFTITRSESTAAETVHYRTVSLSALEGQNFNAANGTLTFAVGETSKTVTVTERTATGMFKYAASSGSSGYRQYRFEVLDANGFLLNFCLRKFEVTRRVKTEAMSGSYDLGNERDGIFFYDATGILTIKDGGYGSNPVDAVFDGHRYLDLPSTAFYDASTQAYLVDNQAQLRMTLDFLAKETDDGYQYVQVLTDNTSTYDSGAKDGDPGTIQLSRYMAGFEIKKGDAYTEAYKKFTFPVLSAGNGEGHTNPWGHGTDFPLSMQKFHNTARATDGKILLNTNFNTLVLRFDASGSNNDNWHVNNINAHITAVDETAPAALNDYITVSPGPYNKGNDFYISVPFSEIVLGGPTLSTSWGEATLFASDGGNVLTFKGTITANAGTTLSVTGYSGTAPRDLFQNNLAGDISKTFTGIVSTDFVREPIGSITYSTTLGAYEINSVANLRDLAVYVNGSGTYSTGGDETTAHNCAGMTFKMTTDIDFQPTSAWDDYTSLEHNFDGIGYDIVTSYSYFSGTFDGQDHTISGIRNNSYSTSSGLFDCIRGTVQNVKIANARITGYSMTGGIVGDIYTGSVSNCHVAHNVAIHIASRGAANVGGIVGMNFNGTVTGCTSAAVITCDVTTDCASFGGIVGYNSSDCTVSGCTATGTIVPDVNNAGAVTGTNKGTVSGNKYHSSMVGNYAFNIGSGTGDIDGATLNTKALMLYTERDNSALLAAYAATYNSNSSTAHGGTTPTVSSLNVTLKGYTLHKDGTWNTIALPFDFTAYTGSPLSGATIKQLDTENTTYDNESGVLQVAFKTVTVNTSTGMDRTKPYIVRWSSGTDVTDPTFTNVDGRRLANTIGSTTDAPLIIRGSSKPFTLTDGMLLDAHNADNLGCHAAIILSAPEASDGQTFDGWFTDEQRTVAPTFIPFGSDGSFNLYAKLTKNAITLTGVDDVAAALSTYAGKTCEVTYTRSLTADKPSTVCLPFAYTKKEGEKFYAFTDITKDGSGKYIATMTEPGESTLEANKPYLFMPTGDADFSGTYAIPATIEAGSTTSGHWTFKGVYAYKEWAANDPEIGKAYGFAGVAKTGIEVGDFVRVTSGAKIRPMSCYLLWSDTPSNARALTRGADDADELPQSITVRLVGSDGETTAIGTLDTRTGEIDLNSDGWYDMSGRRLSGKPSQKGVYIRSTSGRLQGKNNGKMVIVK